MHPGWPGYLGYLVRASVHNLGYKLFILFITADTSAILAIRRYGTGKSARITGAEEPFDGFVVKDANGLKTMTASQK